MGWESLSETRGIDLRRPSHGRRLPQIIVAFGSVLTIAWIVFLAWVIL
jgi:hypothetical protein